MKSAKQKGPQFNRHFEDDDMIMTKPATVETNKYTLIIHNSARS